MRSIVVIPQLPEELVDRIRKAAPGFAVLHGAAKEPLQQQLSKAEIVCGWHASVVAACMEPMSQLRWIQAWGAGVDKLPLDTLSERGIILTTASGVHPYPVSETAFAMMLSFSRKLHISIRHQTNRQWQDAGALTEMHGKTIGIVGVGAIGEELAVMAKAFGMTTLGIRRSGAPAASIDQMYDISGMDTVLRKSDYVVACMPLTDETFHMFGRAQFESMKPSSYFINVSRGATTDTEALLDALQKGRIAGAGLDVFEQEPLPSDHPLWGLDNVIMTPHNGGVTDRYHERAMDIFLTNLASYLQTEEPCLNIVHSSRQY